MINISQHPWDEYSGAIMTRWWVDAMADDERGVVTGVSRARIHDDRPPRVQLLPLATLLSRSLSRHHLGLASAPVHGILYIYIASLCTSGRDRRDSQAHFAFDMGSRDIHIVDDRPLYRCIAQITASIIRAPVAQHGQMHIMREEAARALIFFYSSRSFLLTLVIDV